MALYLNTVSNHYLELLNLFALVLDGQKGYTPDDPRWVECQDLAIKLFFHASSIFDLSQGTRVSLPAHYEPTFFFDFPSVAVLARAALDAYLTLFEVFLNQPRTTCSRFAMQSGIWLAWCCESVSPSTRPINLWLRSGLKPSDMGRSCARPSG